MVSSRLLIFQSAIFILTAQAVAWPDYLYHVCIVEKGNYTANSTYEANFNDLLLSLSSITKIDHGFYHSSYGQNSDQVYGIGLCRGDVNAYDCSGCLNNAASLLRESCPQQKEAIGWYNEYMLRYSNRSILGVLESLRSQAAAGGPDLKFAAGNATAPNFQTLYALVQCTPDLSEQECNDCLLESKAEVSSVPAVISGAENPKTGGEKPKTDGENPAAAPGHGGSPIGIIIFGLTVPCAALIAMGIYLSVKRKSKNNGTMNVPTIELGSLQVHPGSLSSSADISSSSAQLPKLMDKRNGNAPNKDKLKKVWKKLTTMFRLGKKKDEFVVTPINKEIEIQELMPQPMLESDAVMPSSSTSELDEYKWRNEEAEREVHIQREKISSLRKEMQEEVNSMKRQQTQQQQEMEAKQRQMEQQIEFLLSGAEGGRVERVQTLPLNS